MDEWILVDFPELRAVLVDETQSGATNKPMLVQRGHHIIGLDGDQNYIAPLMPVAVFNTTSQLPMILVFILA